MGALPWREVLGGWTSMGLAAGIMGALAWLGLEKLDLRAFHGLAGTSVRLFPLIGVCALAYAGLLFAFRVPEASALWRTAKRRLGRA
jgi:hypothetical protein